MIFVRILLEFLVAVGAGGVAWYFVGRPLWAYARQLPRVHLWTERREIDRRRARLRLLREEVAVRKEELKLLEAEADIDAAENRVVGLDEFKRKGGE